MFQPPDSRLVPAVFIFQKNLVKAEYMAFRYQRRFVQEPVGELQISLAGFRNRQIECGGGFAVRVVRYRRNIYRVDKDAVAG